MKLSLILRSSFSIDFDKPQPKLEPKPSQVKSKAWSEVFYIVTMCPHACPIPSHAYGKFNIPTSTEHNQTKIFRKSPGKNEIWVENVHPLVSQIQIFRQTEGGPPK